MIYSDDIEIAVLGSPLTFTLPKDYTFNYGQLEYIPVLYNNHYVQIIISESLYTQSDLSLNMYDCSGRILSSFPFDKIELSENKYYAETNIILGYGDELVYFIISDGATRLADSIIYQKNPYYRKLHKTISYHHRKNDFNVIFNDNTEKWFKLSIECGFNGDSLEAIDDFEDFNQQDMSNIRVYSHPRDTYKLIIGSGAGIPQYLYTKLSKIFSCSDLILGKHPFKIANGAKLEKENILDNGLGIYSIKIQFEEEFNEFDFYK